MTADNSTTSHPNFKDMTGMVFARLTVISRAANAKHGRAQWLCTCTCGTIKIIPAHDLRSGAIVSCGCYLKEQTGNRFRRKPGMISGDSSNPLYDTWAGLIARCYMPQHISYKHYGNRGIKVCDRWRNNFALFCSDMGPKPNATDSIDRINNNGDYAPDNCRWVSHRQQNRNMRTNVHLTFKERRYVQKDLAAYLNISRYALSYRCRTAVKGRFPLLPDGTYDANVLLTHPISPRQRRS